MKYKLVLIFGILFLFSLVSAVNYASTNDVYTGFTWDNYKNYSTSWSEYAGKLFYTGGNIGIGTSSPQNKLQVVGDINATGVYYGNASQLTGILGSQISNNLNWINYTNVSGDFVPYTGSTANVALGSYDFSVNTSDFFVDVSSGNVGIGTTAPNSKLEVAGTFNATSNGGTLQLDESGNIEIGI